MGKFNPPSAYEPRTDDVRQRDNAGESSPPVRERSKDFRAANRMRSCQSAKEVVSAGYSDPAERTRSRRATVSFVLPENHRSDVESPGRSRPSSTPPTSRTTAPPGPPRRSPRPSSILLRGRNLQRAIQDRYPSILECLNNHLGDAQASPFHKQDATDVSPIVVAARHVREYGRSARAEALQTVGMLLKRIDQQKVSKVEIRNVFFILCIDMFARDPLDNIAEVSLAFQLFRVLVQEEILQGSDFIRAAITLCEEGHYDGCKLFTQLAVDDKKTDLAESEVEILADIVSNLKLDQNKGKKNVT